MSRVAHEVSRRMTPEYAKERAREMARDRAMRMKDGAVESSWLGPLLGAGIGAVVARALRSRAREREWEPRGYGGYREGWSVEDRGWRSPYDASERDAPGGAEGETGSALKERASAVKDQVRSAAEEVRGRVQEGAGALRERIPDRARLRESARDDAGLWALGALALGALFGFALPVSRRERELLEPAARKVREMGEQARDLALEKGGAAMDEATSRVEGDNGGEEQSEPAPSPLPGSPAPLH